MAARFQRIGAIICASVLVVATPAAAQKRKQVKPKGPVPTEQFAAPTTGTGWVPEDVDSSVPPADTSAPCVVNKVVAEAGSKVQELVSLLPQFTATEHMEHFEADDAGNWSKPKIVDFDYLVEMKKIREGTLVMDELRDGRQSLERFPAHLATLGLPAVAMVFHPFYVNELEMKCEGMAWRGGRPAWQIHFQQRPDKYPRLRGYRVKNVTYALRLKGRAWIDADTYQVLHIDTDLLEPINAIPLLREHLSVDYGPVHFTKQNEDLWLQQKADVYMDFKGHHYRRTHTFTNFLLFSVDVDQKDAAPTGH